MTTLVFDHNTPIVGWVSRLISDVLGGAADFAMNYASRVRAESQLASLDDHMLSDIGLERADIHGKIWGADAR